MALSKVSIIVPVYNVEKYIRKCLDSLINQTLRDIEIIIVDDGSPDHSPEIIDEYAAGDSRIKVIHKENGGVSRARNDGLAQADGEYVFFCDSDDWLENDAMEQMYSSAMENHADVVISDFCEAKEDNFEYRHVFSNEFVAHDPAVIQVIQNTVFPKGYSALSSSAFKRGYCLGAPWHHLIRRSLITDNGLYFDPYVKGIFDDGIFMLNVFEHAKNVSYIAKNTYYYRIVSGSLTHKYNPSILDTYDRIYERISEFSKKYNKDHSFTQAYYVRVLYYLNKALSVCFMNKHNDKSDSERFKEFVLTAQREPYQTAIRQVRLKDFGSRKMQAIVLLLKARRFRLLWMIKNQLHVG